MSYQFSNMHFIMIISHFFLTSLMTQTSAIAKPAPKKGPRILCVGDSLTDGYGVDKKSAYPAQLEKRLHAGGLPHAQVINAGTPGATSSSGLTTLKFHFKRMKPDLVIYALGANDGLRGISVQETEKKLAAALEFMQSAGVKVILTGMQAPPNYGKKFPKEFAAIFPRLAKKYNVHLMPFLLDGVGGERNLNQADGIHPNEAGYKVVSQNLYDQVRKIYVDSVN